MLKRLSHADDRYREIEQMLTLPEVIANNKEYQKLNEDYNNLEDIIKFLDEYIEEKGYKSKSHNLAIRRWVADAVSEKKVKRKEAKQFERPAWLDMDL